jgi:hypothetical protein
MIAQLQLLTETLLKSVATAFHERGLRFSIEDNREFF